MEKKAKSVNASTRQPIPVAMWFKVWGLRALTCWDCGFESCQEHGCRSALCCRVEVSAKGLSLVQRSPTACVCVCVSDRERERDRDAKEPHRGRIGSLRLSSHYKNNTKTQIKLLHTDTIKQELRKSKNNQTQFIYWFFF